VAARLSVVADRFSDDHVIVLQKPGIFAAAAQFGEAGIELIADGLLPKADPELAGGCEQATAGLARLSAFKQI